jgi:hypothetical protein
MKIFKNHKWRTHGALDVELLDLLPVFGQKVDEEVDSLASKKQDVKNHNAMRIVINEGNKRRYYHGEIGHDGFFVLADIGDSEA